MENQTTVMEFILLGLADDDQLQYVFFTTLLVTYILSLTGNILIITITLINRHLHTPMYFFLRNFSIIEIGFTTTVIPKALANLALGKKTISLRGCLTQTFLYFMLGTTEFLLLAIMSFDRYVAICKPLHYVAIMNSQVCSLLAIAAWIGGAVLILSPSVVYFQMPFCGSNIINHFFCDSTPMIELKCGNTKVLECMILISAVFTLLGSLAITAVSYINIIAAVVKIPAVAGRQKAFSTCASHLTVVSVTYGSCIFMYLTQTNRLDLSKVVSILNTVVSPLLNPFIYSLRNTQLQEALRESIKWSIVISKHPEI
ncbi:olfactory receptor 6C74-like [Calonectris borealis]|uniref:olfactory receptor 6C74-like n=1 Tax=Calonectris borealis TaxID=1323832 RepID=UPI003F4BDB2C